MSETVSPWFVTPTHTIDLRCVSGVWVCGDYDNSTQRYGIVLRWRQPESGIVQILVEADSLEQQQAWYADVSQRLVTMEIVFPQNKLPCAHADCGHAWEQHTEAQGNTFHNACMVHGCVCQYYLEPQGVGVMTPTEGMARLRALVGRYFEGVDVDTYMRAMRGEDKMGSQPHYGLPSRFAVTPPTHPQNKTGEWLCDGLTAAEWRQEAQQVQHRGAPGYREAMYIAATLEILNAG